MNFSITDELNQDDYSELTWDQIHQVIFFLTLFLILIHMLLMSMEIMSLIDIYFQLNNISIFNNYYR